MPPRRPPPLMPRARLVEAINATPVDTRTKPAHVFDTRVVIDCTANDSQATLQPWTTSSSSDSTGYRSDVESRRSSRSLALNVLCIGCIYYISGRSLTENFQEVLEGLTSSTFQAYFIIPEGLSDSQKARKALHNDRTVVLGQTRTIQGLRLAPLAQHRDKSAIANDELLAPSSSGSLLVLEVPLGSSEEGIGGLPSFLGQIQLGQSDTSHFRPKVLIGAMGRPALSLLVKGGRTGLDAYERALSELAFYPSVYWQFAGYLSLLPESMVLAAFGELCNGPSSGGGDAYKTCKKAISACFSIVLEAFGEDRIVWGSDWPLEGFPAGQSPAYSAEQSWSFSLKLALDVACDIGLRGEALDKIFYGNAQKLRDDALRNE